MDTRSKASQRQRLFRCVVGVVLCLLFHQSTVTGEVNLWVGPRDGPFNGDGGSPLTPLTDIGQAFSIAAQQITLDDLVINFLPGTFFLCVRLIVIFLFIFLNYDKEIIE